MSYKDEAAVWDVDPAFNLTSTEARVLAFLANCKHRKTGRIFPSDKLIAEKIGKCRRTVLRARLRLLEVGLIGWNGTGNGEGGRGSNEYWLNLDAIPKGKSDTNVTLHHQECPQSPQDDRGKSDTGDREKRHGCQGKVTPVSHEQGSNKVITGKEDSAAFAALDDHYDNTKLVNVDCFLSEAEQQVCAQDMRNLSLFTTPETQIMRFIERNMKTKKTRAAWRQWWLGWLQERKEPAPDGKWIGIDEA